VRYFKGVPKILTKGSKETFKNLDDWFTVHRSITLVDFQLDAQNSY
jgi:hypothetical protein